MAPVRGPSGKRIRHIAQLTLFPRVSKTSKANFGYRLTIFREHFFKHRFFKDDKLVILTLMKGDEGVETREKCTNGLLLGDVGESYTKPFEITRMYMDDSFSLCLLSKHFLTRTMRQTIGEE